MGLRLVNAVVFSLAIPLAGVGGFVNAHDGDPKAGNRTPFSGPRYLRSQPSPLGGVLPFGPTEFPSQGVFLLSWLPLGEFGPNINSGNDCWGYVSDTGREYAIICTSAGTGYVDITNPANAQVIAHVPGPVSFWRDVKVFDHYAYAVSERGGGIQVIDLSAIDNGVVTDVGSVTTGGVQATHNVAVNETSGFLYRCGGGDRGLRIYSLADPANPQFVGEWSDRYVHDAQIVSYTDGPYAGREIAFCCSGFNGGWVQTGLDIVDVTDKANPFVVHQLLYEDGEYSHQAWLSDDRRYLYLNDELDESNLGVPTNTKVIDVSNLERPFEVTVFDNGNPAIGHNLYLRGDTIFEANYRSGLRVFDATDPLNTVEVAFFDTYPDDDVPAFNGLWGVYPLFPSGSVIGSDVERGLFVWHSGLLALGFHYPAGPPRFFEIANGTFEVEIIEQTAPLAPGSALLHLDAGSGFIEIPLAPRRGSLFAASLPTLPCGSRVSYYVSAETVGGNLVTDPPFAPPPFFQTVVASHEEIRLADDLESDSGWTVGGPGDLATAGVWERGDPVGTEAQPEDDHTPAGTQCWFTGASDDVDGGRTSLNSPLLDASGLDAPRISYWRWFSNREGAAPQSDAFRVLISNDGGNSWALAETVGPAGEGTGGGWTFHEFFISDLVTPTSEMQLRFIADDGGQDSTVEAAIDDLRITGIVCAECDDEFIRGDADGSGELALADGLHILGWLFAMGPDPTPIEAADVDGDGEYALADALHLLEYLFLNGAEPAPPFPDPGCP